MLLAEYGEVRVNETITGLICTGCIPLEEDFDETKVELYNCYGSITLMITFLFEGYEFDTVSFPNLTTELVEVLNKGVLIQDLQTEVQLFCKTSHLLSIPA